jgi:hypothetical protein
MKIASQTSDQMVLKDSNGWGAFIAVITILFGFLFTFWGTTGGFGIGNIIFWIIALAVAVVDPFL